MAQSQPSGSRLLARLAQVARAKGSVHIAGFVDAVAVKKQGNAAEVPWMHLVSHSRTDTSYKQNLMETYQTQETVTTGAGKTTRHVDRSHMVTVGHSAASQSNGGAWTCQTLKGGSRVQPFALGLGYPVRRPVNLGASNLGGIPVWHVQGTITTSWVVATSRPVRADYYISRADGTLLRESASPVAVSSSQEAGKPTRTIVRGTMSLTYSRWGTPLHPSLPAACRARR